MKKIVNLILSVIFTMNIFAVSSVYAENSDITVDTAHINFLQMLGVFGEVDSAGVSAPVSREDFAYYMAKAAGIPTTGNEQSRKYIDVPTYSYAFSAINNLAEYGIISANPEGIFRPYDYITYIEACTMLLNAMNYDVLAKNYGAWPYGYQNVVAKLDVDIADFNAELTLYEAARLIVEFMKLPTYKIESNEYNSTGESLLERVFSIECGEGTVEAFSGGTLDSNEIMRKKHIKISGEIFEVSEEFDESPFFGNYVEYYYYNESGKEEIVYIHTAEGAEEDFIIDIECFDSYSKDSISYYKDENSSNTKSVSLEDEHTVIYNGMPLSTKVSETLNNLNKGSITLKDSDDNGKYDVVLIVDYKNFVVSTYDPHNLVAYDRLVLGNKLEFSDKTYLKIYSGHEEVSYDSLVTDSVLSVAQSQDGEIMTILISNNFIKGKLESLNERYAVIDGTEYEMENSLKDSFPADVGVEYVFHIDSFGKIAYVSPSETKRMKFAYLIKGILSEDDDSYSFKMLTEDNKIEYLKAAKKVTVDGDRIDTTEGLKLYFTGTDGKFVPQLIQFVQNNAGEITEIDTVLVKNDYEDPDYSLRHVFGDTKPGDAWWGQSGRYMFKALLRTQVVTFMVPKEAEADDKYYRVASSWKESTGTTAGEWWEAVDMYWRSDNSGYVDVIVKATAGTVEKQAKDVLMVSEVGKAWDEAESKTVLELKGIDSTGSSVTLHADMEMCDDGIEKGDLVTISSYMTGETAGAKIVYDASKGGEPIGFTNATIDGFGDYLLLSQGNQQGKYRHATQISFGYAKKVFDDNIVSMSRYLGGDETERMVFPSAVAVCDSETGEIYSGSIADVLSYEAVGDSCSKLFYHTYVGVGKGMFIYR